MNDQTYLLLILIDQNCINSILTGYITLGSSQKKSSKIDALSSSEVGSVSWTKKVSYDTSSHCFGITDKFIAVCVLKQYLTNNVSYSACSF